MLIIKGWLLREGIIVSIAGTLTSEQKFLSRSNLTNIQLPESPQLFDQSKTSPARQPCPFYVNR